MKSVILALSFLITLSACSQKGFEALDSVAAETPGEGTETPTTPETPPTSQTAKSDFISGEVVTTTSGFVIRGAFGEISEKKTTANGYQIEGAFYE